MPSTPTYGLRYQGLGDPPNGPDLGKNLAEDVEAQIARLDGLLGARGIMADPISTTSLGTVTAANLVEVRDGVFGDYTFVSAGTSRRYKVYFVGCRPSVNSGSGLVFLRVRMASGSTPTTSSTLILDKSVYVSASGGAGQESRDLIEEFTTTAGSWTLSTFTIGNNTVTTPTGPRKLWVEDIGPS